MRVLILGGTQFVGRHIAEAMLAGGHVVTLLNRGQTPDALPAAAERLRGDRDAGDAGLSALRGRTWDACVDVSGYTPRRVRPTVSLLQPAVGQYVFVSAVSVYGDPPRGPVLESHARLPPAGDDVVEIDAQMYGPLKVACEDVVHGAFGERCALLRPQVVVGPHEPGSRFTYWLWRAARPGPMLAPGDGSDFVQVVDARDVAAFARRAVEHGIAGAFNLAGNRVTWAEFIGLLRPAGEVVWVGRDVIAAAGVTEFELPLYRASGGRRASLMDVSPAAAVKAGLTLTPLHETVEAARRWFAGREPPPPALSPEREAELIDAARRSARP